MSQILTPAGKQLEQQRQALDKMGERIDAATPLKPLAQKRKEQRARKMRKKLQRRLRRAHKAGRL